MGSGRGRDGGVGIGGRDGCDDDRAARVAQMAVPFQRMAKRSIVLQVECNVMSANPSADGYASDAELFGSRAERLT